MSTQPESLKGRVDELTEYFPVIHAEMPVSGDGIPEPRGLQLWIDLPKQYKMVDPSYQELDPKQYVPGHMCLTHYCPCSRYVQSY